MDPILFSMIDSIIIRELNGQLVSSGEKERVIEYWSMCVDLPKLKSKTLSGRWEEILEYGDG